VGVGTELTVRGTGCIDPEASGTEVTATVGLSSSSGLGAATGRVEADGSFEVRTTVEADVPSDTFYVEVTCVVLGETPYRTIHQFGPVAIQGKARGFDDFRVEADRVSFADVCTGVTASTGVDGSVSISDPQGNELDIESHSTADGRTEFLLPPDLPPGTYRVDGGCSGQRQPDTIVYRSTTFTWPASAAQPAGAVSGSPTYTG
jgi:hypothetical protein